MTKQQFENQALALTDTLYRISCTMLPRLHDRADAVQSCLLKAWQKLPTLRDEANFRPWLIRILINECRMIYRKDKRLLYTDAPEKTQNLPDHTLRDAILALPEVLRLPVVLHYVEGASVRETAIALSIPEGTVKTRLRRARSLLKETLAEEV